MAEEGISSDVVSFLPLVPHVCLKFPPNHEITEPAERAQVPVLFDARCGVPGNVSGGGPSPRAQPSAHGDHFPHRRQHKNPPLSSPWLCFCVWGSEEVIAACIWVIKTPDGPRDWLVVAGRQRHCPLPPVFSSSSGTVT